MKNRLVLCLVMLLFSSCITAKRDIQKNAGRISQEAVSVAADQDQIIAAADAVGQAAGEVQEASKDIRQVGKLLTDIRRAATQLAESATTSVKEGLQEISQDLGAAQGKLQRAIPVITTNVTLIKEKASSTKQVAKQVSNYAADIVQDSNDVVNKDNIFQVLWGRLTGFFGGLGILGWVLVIALGPSVIGIIPMMGRLLPGAMARTGLGISSNQKDMSFLLYRALNQPSEDTVSSAVTRFRATKGGEAAWRVARRKHQKWEQKNPPPVVENTS